MPKYTLTYFNGRGRAEISRYLFALAGVEFEDNRIQREQWPDLKKTMPFGQLPVLEVDGVQISQALAIARFLAKRLGFAGKDEIQQALADSYVLAVDDIFSAMVQSFHEKDEERKAQMQKKFKEETVPDKLSKLEAIIAANPSGYFVGDEFTWADLVVYDMMDWLRRRTLSDAELSAYPKIVAMESKVKALPNIVSWIAKRPESEF